MIPTIIILLVIAIALGGYIAFDVIKEKKKKAAVPNDVPNEALDEVSNTDTAATTKSVMEIPFIPEEETAPAFKARVEIVKPNERSNKEISKSSENLYNKTVEPNENSNKEILRPYENSYNKMMATNERPNDEIMEINESNDDDIAQIMPVEKNGQTQYIVIKYNKSFLAKLIQSDNETKSYYSQLKNCLLSYDGVKNRISWKCESFRIGKKTLAKLRLRGKTLSLCLALNAEDYEGSKYKLESAVEIKSYADTPSIYRIKSDRRLKYGEELIAELMNQNGIVEKKTEEIDYVKNYPYETTEALIERKLIKELTDEDAQSGTTFLPSRVREKVAAYEVDNLMQDDVAATLIKKSDGKSDRTKTGIVNIDTLSQYFESGEKVTLNEIKKRVKGFNKQTTYLKVLARGIIDKSLIVEADSFSLQAVKMIVLTGGTVIKK